MQRTCIYLSWQINLIMKAFMYLFNLRWQGGTENGDRWCWCRCCGTRQDAGQDGHPCEAVGGEGLWHQEERPRHLQIQGVGPRPPKREEMWLVFLEGKKEKKNKNDDHLGFQVRWSRQRSAWRLQTWYCDSGWRRYPQLRHLLPPSQAISLPSAYARRPC